MVETKLRVSFYLVCLLLFACFGSSAAEAGRRVARASKHNPYKRVGALTKTMARRTKGLQKRVLRLALRAFACAWQRHARRRTQRPRLRRPLLTIIDYSLPSNRKRLWTLDLQRKKLLYYEHVAHGKYTGGRWARHFSNRNRSKKSSLGLFITGRTYHGSNGFSLRLDGLERGINHNARRRAIVMHGAWYVSRSFLRRHGRLGRSWGCPSVRKSVARRLLNRIKRGTALFIYYPQRKWLRRSTYLRCKP